MSWWFRGSDQQLHDERDHLPSIRLDQSGVTLDPLEEFALPGLRAIQGKKQCKIQLEYGSGFGDNDS
jgi:hypothetical protein